MNLAPTALLPLRQHLLRRAGLLLALSAALVAAVFMVFGLKPMAHQSALNQFDLAAQQVESGLGSVFVPAQRLLGISPLWLGDQPPSQTSPQAFNRLYKPLLTVLTDLTSVVAGTSDGQGWLLLNQGANRWRNRFTDVARWGNQKHWVWEEDAAGSVTRTWVEQLYDPRHRPWFSGAMMLPAGAVHWTEPYLFFTTREPGISASTRWRLADGRDFVLALDLKLKDLSLITQRARVGRRGMAMVLAPDGRLLALPADGQRAGRDVGKLLLAPPQALGLPVVDAAWAMWQQRQRQPVQAQPVQAEDEVWLASFRPFSLGNQSLWVLVLAPESDFAPDWQPMLLALALAAVMVAAIGVWVVRLGNRRLAEPLEALAHNSRAIGALEFDNCRPIVSGVAEIQELGDRQQQMRNTLQQNQQALDTHARQLAQQLAQLQGMQSDLQAQHDRLRTVLENFPAGVTVVDERLQVIAFNARFVELLNLPQSLVEQGSFSFEEVIRHNARRLNDGPDELEPRVQRRLNAVNRREPYQVRRTLPDGRSVEIRGRPLPSGGFVALYTDVTAELAHERRLEHLAHFDGLTGLPNRVLLADRLRQAMALVQRRGTQLAVAYLDLDGFKQVNDRLGHATGDALLVALTQRMRLVLRDGDTLARLGGDEFVAVLLDVQDPTHSAAMMGRMLAAVCSPVALDGQELSVTASVGVTYYPQHAEVDGEQLIRQADQAMYTAKQSGKNRCHAFDTEQDRSQRGQFESLNRMIEALERREFVLYYQPKVNLRSGRVLGMEALIRWQHPQQGLIPPGQFLPVLEGKPLALAVGEWVIRSALAQLARWKAQGLALGISVNVGALQLQNAGFVDFLRLALAEQPGVRPEDLTLEVLETSALEDVERVTERMTECSALGVAFALDDFGTGYSSLTYLKRLPVAQLKIDQSFVRDMLDDPDDLSILQGVLDLAASFRREAVAEGVETAAHGRMLLQLGCECAQGYGIARPMPAQQVVHWVQSWQPDPLWSGVRAIERAVLPLLVAQVDLRAWTQRLARFLNEERSHPPELDPAACALSRCLRSEPVRALFAPEHLQEIDALHLSLHHLAAQLCDLAGRGLYGAAQSQWPGLVILQDQLIAALQARIAPPDG